ncbi:helix-turn-helix domain-containing protein [Nocardia sp. CC227C]|uniref:helix-turn-helix domain-containing protein n=1 Tax=Nocardia sp. CC227C TaxID=3044562 RepID=UPI00278C274D|nr:helix-turn-helix domain-containing protein [Nocardia sp. CC227C]
MFPINTATAEAVRDAIARTELTAASVAQGAHITPTAWRRRMRGQTAFTMNELSRIAAVIGVQIGRLIDLITEKLRMTSTDELRLYTLSETAERLHVTEDWLKKRVRSGRIPGRKSGRVWTFAPDDIRAAIAAMAPTSAADANRHLQGEGGAV